MENISCWLTISYILISCFIQGALKSPWRLTTGALTENLYPGDSSYEAETGGDLVNLRNSTTLEKVKAYHKKYYQPDNFNLIITGQVDAKDVFKVSFTPTQSSSFYSN